LRTGKKIRKKNLKKDSKSAGGYEERAKVREKKGH